MKFIGYLLIAAVAFVCLLPACGTETDDNVNPTDPRDKFLGEWKVNETCNRLNYTVQISADPGNSTQVLIQNFGNPGPGYDPAVGLVVSNAITVGSQLIGEGWTVSGTGIYQTGGTITWNYSLKIGQETYSCSATYSK